MKKIQEFILREVADEYLLIPTGSTTENFNGIITLTESAAFIYEHIEEANTFEIIKSADGESLDEMYVNGTITINGSQKKILIKAILSYNYNNDAYEWDIFAIYGEGNSGYKDL